MASIGSRSLHSLKRLLPSRSINRKITSSHQIKNSPSHNQAPLLNNLNRNRLLPQNKSSRQRLMRKIAVTKAYNNKIAARQRTRRNESTSSKLSSNSTSRSLQIRPQSQVKSNNKKLNSHPKRFRKKSISKSYSRV